MDAEDSKLQFAFNDTLVNKHFEEILDLMSARFSSKQDILSTRNKILDLLNETFINITADKLSEGFNIFIKAAKIAELDKYIKYSTISEVITSFAKISKFAFATHNNYTDHGYSLVLMGYFWLTSQYLKSA